MTPFESSSLFVRLCLAQKLGTFCCKNIFHCQTSLLIVIMIMVIIIMVIIIVIIIRILFFISHKNYAAKFNCVSPKKFFSFDKIFPVNFQNHWHIFFLLSFLLFFFFFFSFLIKLIIIIFIETNNYRTYQGKFAIHPETGAVTVADTLDWESRHNYILVIEAWDNYQFGYTAGESRNAFKQIPYVIRVYDKLSIRFSLMN